MDPEPQSMLALPWPSLLLLLLLSGTGLFGQTQLVELASPAESAATQVRAAGLDLWTSAPPYWVALHNAHDWQRFQALGLAYQTRSHNIEAEYAARLLQEGSLSAPPLIQGSIGGFPTLSQAQGFLDQLVLQFQDRIAPARVIGTSAEGRPILAYRVGEGAFDAAPKPTLVIDALHHAREPMSLLALLHFADRVVRAGPSDPEWAALRRERTIWLLPCVNPDGYAYNCATHPNGGGVWRKNRRPLPGGDIGVDLNRNYPTYFAFDDVGSSPNPATQTYRGPAPLSEPATQAVSQFLRELKPDGVFSLHAFAPAFGVPPGHVFGARPAPHRVGDYERLLETQRALTPAVPASWLPEVLPRANGTLPDWVEFGLCGGGKTYCGLLEIGDLADGFWPAPVRQPTLAEEASQRMLRFAQDIGPKLVARVESQSFAAGPTGLAVTFRVLIENRGLLASGPMQLWAEIGGGAPGVALALPSLAPGARLRTGPLALDLNAVGPRAYYRGSVRIIAAGQDLRVDLEGPEGGQRERIHREDFEGPTGQSWTSGAPGDTASGSNQGQWILEDPNGTLQPGVAGFWNPEEDATPGPGGRCWFTGQGPPGGSYTHHDVDGTTTLTSPAFDLAAWQDLEISFRSWFATNAISGQLDVDISCDDGQTFERLKSARVDARAWVKTRLSLARTLVPSDRFRLRLVARDADNQGAIEAAFDDFEITGIANPCRLSLHGTGPNLDSLQITAPDFPAASYLVLVAERLGPGIPWSGGHFPLAEDALLRGLLAAPNAFPNFRGQLDSRGQSCRLLPTAPPALAGMRVWIAALLYDQRGGLANSGALALDL